jgi:hypothetical protein
MQPRVRDLLKAGATLEYVGREEAASPATGNASVHKEEVKEILAAALDLKNRSTTPATLPAAGVAASNQAVTVSK